MHEYPMIPTAVKLPLPVFQALVDRVGGTGAGAKTAKSGRK